MMFSGFFWALLGHCFWNGHLLRGHPSEHLWTLVYAAKSSSPLEQQRTRKSAVRSPGSTAVEQCAELADDGENQQLVILMIHEQQLSSRTSPRFQIIENQNDKKWTFSSIVINSFHFSSLSRSLQEWASKWNMRAEWSAEFHSRFCERHSPQTL